MSAEVAPGKPTQLHCVHWGESDPCFQQTADAERCFPPDGKASAKHAAKALLQAVGLMELGSLVSHHLAKLFLLCLSPSSNEKDTYGGGCAAHVFGL